VRITKLALLEIRNLCKHFGGLAAVNELEMDVHQGEILGLIGPNGAGKSTVLNMIGGTLLPTRGEIIFQGENITNYPAYRRAQKGIARVFQRNALFSSMTVIENLLAGSQLHSRNGIVEIFFKSAAARNQEKVLHEKAMEGLTFAGLQQLANELATNLPHGNQRALCLATALATGPKFLLLDEPLTGMNAEEMEAIMSMIKALRDEKGITSIVVEHNIRAVIGLCDRIVVLDYGKKICQGLPKEVVETPCVIEAYLGADRDVI
jgi:branched-chain amino acid transport system ATP-binding protein